MTWHIFGCFLYRLRLERAGPCPGGEGHPMSTKGLHFTRQIPGRVRLCQVVLRTGSLPNPQPQCHWNPKKATQGRRLVSTSLKKKCYSIQSLLLFQYIWDLKPRCVRITNGGKLAGLQITFEIWTFWQPSCIYHLKTGFLVRFLNGKY